LQFQFWVFPREKDADLKRQALSPWETKIKSYVRQKKIVAFDILGIFNTHILNQIDQIETSETPVNFKF